MAVKQPSILIVEDELAIVELVRFTLNQAGWNTDVVSTAEEAWAFLQEHTPQLIVLDWMLPAQSGLHFLSKTRANRDFAQLPIIMLTAKSVEEDKIAGLNHGADDYITKPFSPRELTARVKALLRRQAPEHALNKMKVGAVSLDPISCAVSIDTQNIQLGRAEYKLLKFLLAHPEKVFSRGHLLDKVWGSGVFIEERTVDVHVLRLRKALGKAESLIKTVRGIGYMLSEK